MIKSSNSFETLSLIVAYAVLDDTNSTLVQQRPTRSLNLTQPPASIKLDKSQPDWMKWKMAMDAEVHSLTEKGVFKYVSQLPPGHKAIPPMWVYTDKYGPVGEIVNEKARLLCSGICKVL